MYNMYVCVCMCCMYVCVCCVYFFYDLGGVLGVLDEWGCVLHLAVVPMNRDVEDNVVKAHLSFFNFSFGQ